MKTTRTPTLNVERLPYRHAWRQVWERDPDKLLADRRPSFLKRIISEKARVRPNRFFGEAFVAMRWGYQDAWYSSYKWLTSPIWTTGRCLGDVYHRDFKAALQMHFPQLDALQARARAFEAATGLGPVPPDLWLLRYGEHWFVEAKIPPDAVSDGQLAGLALIATCLPSTKPVRVACVYLEEKQVFGRAEIPDLQPRFDAYCRELSLA